MCLFSSHFQTNEKRAGSKSGLRETSASGNTQLAPNQSVYHRLGNDGEGENEVNYDGVNDAVEARSDAVQGRSGVVQARSEDVLVRGDAVQGRSGVVQARSDAVQGRSVVEQARGDSVLAKSGAVQARSDAAETVTSKNWDKFGGKRDSLVNGEGGSTVAASEVQKKEKKRGKDWGGREVGVEAGVGEKGGRDEKLVKVDHHHQEEKGGKKEKIILEEKRFNVFDYEGEGPRAEEGERKSSERQVGEKEKKETKQRREKDEEEKEEQDEASEGNLSDEVFGEATRSIKGMGF